MLRRLLYLTAFLLGTVIDAAAQDSDANQPNDWATFSSNVQTRFGKVRLDEIPDTIEYDHPRFYNDAKIGTFNTWLGPDLNAPNSRFRPAPDRQPLLPSDFLGEKASPRKPVASANTLAPTDTPSVSASAAKPPARRLPGFFERPGMMDSATTSAAEESPIRSSTGPRWFRDLGRRPDGLPGLAPRSVEGSSGDAMSVGPELLQPPPQGQQPDSATATEKPLKVDPQTAARNRAEARRRFEQKLEGMLLSDPSVHFLSPVQVSFQNGIASVRGIVPNKENKVAAGNVLLTDPAVKQVNNLISIVSLDPAQLPEPVEPK